LNQSRPLDASEESDLFSGFLDLFILQFLSPYNPALGATFAQANGVTTMAQSVRVGCYTAVPFSIFDWFAFRLTY
jgi:hypothetical protein